MAIQYVTAQRPFKIKRVYKEARRCQHAIKMKPSRIQRFIKFANRCALKNYVTSSPSWICISRPIYTYLIVLLHAIHVLRFSRGKKNTKENMYSRKEKPEAKPFFMPMLRNDAINKLESICVLGLAASSSQKRNNKKTKQNKTGTNYSPLLHKRRRFPVLFTRRSICLKALCARACACATEFRLNCVKGSRIYAATLWISRGFPCSSRIHPIQESPGLHCITVSRDLQGSGNGLNRAALFFCVSFLFHVSWTNYDPLLRRFSQSTRKNWSLSNLSGLCGMSRHFSRWLSNLDRN